MNLFEDLVEDLKKENLLDDNTKEAVVFSSVLCLTETPKVKKTSATNFKESPQFSNNSYIKIVESPEKPSINSEQPLALEEEIQNLTNNLNTSDSSDQLKKLRKVQIKPKKKGRYCKTCMISVPYYRLSCRFCNQKVNLSGFYYSLILLSAIAITMLIIFYGKKL